MKAEIKAEIRKLTSTRTLWALAAAAAGIAGITALAANAAREFPIGDPLHNLVILRMPVFTGIVLLVLGIRSVTDEYRYGTVSSTTLASPGRARTIAAKAIVAAAAGAVIAAVAEAIVVGAAAGLAATKGQPLVLDGSRLAWITGGVVASGAATAAFGVGLGAVVRHQVMAVVGGILWFLLAEELLSSVTGAVGPYLPAALSQGASHAAFAPGLGPAAAAGLFAAYAATLTGMGALAVRRRDLA